MGSSLSPILVEIYMNDFEKQLITSTKYKDNIKLWSRYVDDVLVIWEGSIEEVHEFINEVDSRCIIFFELVLSLLQTCDSLRTV